MQWAFHYDTTVQRHPDGVYAVAGRVVGVLVAGNKDGFGNGMAVDCTLYLDIADLPKGVFPQLLQHCTQRDAAGDMFFTSFACSTKAFGDLCRGAITGGTGKFSGITGSAEFPVGGGGSYIRRSCLSSAKEEECRSWYATSGAVPVGTVYHLELESLAPVTLEWRIP